jgi:hypothetical protein
MDQVPEDRKLSVNATFNFFPPLYSVKGANNIFTVTIKTWIKECGGGPGQLSLEVVQADGYHQGPGQVILQSVRIWVRIGQKRRQIGAVLRMRLEKPTPRVTAGVAQ